MFISLLRSLFVFFFKQKTAYEMRISDWSSDVCSSDLAASSQIVIPAKRPPLYVIGGARAGSHMHTPSPATISQGLYISLSSRGLSPGPIGVGAWRCPTMFTSLPAASTGRFTLASPTTSPAAYGNTGRASAHASQEDTESRAWSLSRPPRKSPARSSEIGRAQV